VSAAETPPAPGTEYGALADALADRDAVAFVHVGDRFDDDLRYLTRFGGPDRDYAFVYAAGTAVLCPPALFEAQADREFPGDDLRTEHTGDPAGERAAAAVADLAGEAGTVLVPPGIPHDAAVFLQRAGYEPASTAAVADARAVKTAAEIDRIRRVQRATLRGLARAETVLAEATPDGDDLRWEGAPLSTERLRRQVDGVLASHGVDPAGNTVVGAGPTCVDLHFTGLDDVAPGETVLLDVSPRGPAGYYGDATRTFVVDGDGGWERRAHVAVERAREAALAELGPGVSAAAVQREAAAELRAHGFETGGTERGFVHGLGHGVGVSLHEPPSFGGDAALEPGHVLTVEPGVYEPGVGGVRLEDVAVVTGDGYDLLGDLPLSLTPERR